MQSVQWTDTWVSVCKVHLRISESFLLIVSDSHESERDHEAQLLFAQSLLPTRLHFTSSLESCRGGGSFSKDAHTRSTQTQDTPDVAIMCAEISLAVLMFKTTLNRVNIIWQGHLMEKALYWVDSGYNGPLVWGKRCMRVCMTYELRCTVSSITTMWHRQGYEIF